MMTLWRVRPVRALALLATSGLVGAIGGVPALVLAPASPATAAVIGDGSGSAGPMTLTQTMDQWYVSGQPGKQASVTVSQTSDLTRQRVNVSWTGLRPSTSTEYPVMVLQCWGPPSEVKPQHCWTNIRKIDRATLFDDRDYRAVENDPNSPYRESFYEPGDLWGNKTPFQHLASGELPFVGRGDQWFIWNARDNQSEQWPRRTITSGEPPDRSEDTINYVTNPGVTGVDGKGGMPYEVLTDFEAPSLGCTEGKTCSLVVIPIGEPHCRPRSRYMAPLSTPNHASGNLVDRQCSGAASGMRGAESWKSPTNWERRFAFPLTFRKPFQACELTNRPETTLVGSQMARPLMASWRPRFCTDEKLFKLGHTALGDGDARRQFVDNGAARRENGVNGVLTSRAIDGEAGRPVAYGPVSITSVAVAFVLDDANKNEVTSLRLTPRLLAKLVTQSYPGTVASQQPSPVRSNPQWWGADPEFHAVNPGLTLSDLSVLTNFTPVLVQGDHDLVHALTNYIASDPQAVAWLNGEPDEYSKMVVNPAFGGYRVPIEQFELREAWKSAASKTPHQAFADVAWFNLAANDARDLLEAAIATMQSRPLANLQFERADSDAPDTYKRLGRQTVGVRNMLAILDLADARQFQLRTAALQTRRGNTPAEGTFVEPTLSGMQYAMESAVVDEKTGVFSVDHKKLSQYGYPGTMGIYAGLPTAGLPAPLADRYATFLEYAAGPGQTAGTAIGQLPPGYLPLTQPLRDYALKVAAAVRSQKGEVPEPPEKVTPDQGTDTTSRPASPAPPASTPAAGAAPVPNVAASPSKAPALATVSTQTATSRTARWALPALLAVGLAAAVLTPVVALAGQPGHPVRQFANQAVRGILRRRAT